MLNYFSITLNDKKKSNIILNKYRCFIYEPLTMLCIIDRSGDREWHQYTYDDDNLMRHDLTVLNQINELKNMETKNQLCDEFVQRSMSEYNKYIIDALKKPKYTFDEAKPPYIKMQEERAKLHNELDSIFETMKQYIKKLESLKHVL